MFKFLIKVLFAVSIIVVFVSSQNALACVCVNPSPIYKEFEKADSVFVGKIISARKVKSTVKDDEDENFEYRVQVIEVFKNIKNKQVTINGGSVNTSCSRQFDVGESYLIYAYRENENSLTASLACSRTGVLRTAQDQVFLLRDLLKGKAEPQIYGSVSRTDTIPQTLDSRISYLPNIKVIVSSDKKKFETKTDKNGIFRFDNLVAGKYKMELIAPQVYDNGHNDVREFEILPSKFVKQGDDVYFDETNSYKNLFINFSFDWTNKLTGNVLDHEGNAVENVCTKLLPLTMMN